MIISDFDRRSPSALRHLLKSEAAGGILLMLAAALAMVIANSSLGPGYHQLLNAETGPVLSAKLGPMTAHLWINEAAMAIFFLLVGLELKREFLDGRLTSWKRRRLPIVAAAAGMIVPALIYTFFTRDVPALLAGWAIPAATDIAFAIGVLALLGRRAPTALKLFLLTVAIVDDLGVVVVIALFYTAGLDFSALGAGAVVFLLLYGLGRIGVARLWVYVAGAILLWYFILLSGVHATVAGVLAAATVPLVKSPGAPDAAASPLHRLEHGLSPWVGFGVLPLFALANAGVSIRDVAFAGLWAPLPLGVAAGLFLGKQVGVFAAVWLSVRLGLANRLHGTTWLQVYGVCILCGIGFTMSLFIGTLAFPSRPDLVEEAKLGILLGSVLSAVAGFLVLRFAPAAVDRARAEALP